jgi:hypothetical protein
VALASGSSRAGVAPAEVQRVRRRTVMPIEIDTVKVGVGGQESFAVLNLHDYRAAKFLPRTVE